MGRNTSPTTLNYIKKLIMERLKKYTLLILLPLFAACNDFLDVNNNPNAPVSENLALSAKLPAAQVYTAQMESVMLNQLGAFWGGYWGAVSEAITRFRKESTYNGLSIMANRDGIHIWENGYAALMYYQLIREQALQESEGFYLGIAQIMQGWHFLRLVDVYGDIPFDEALQGTRFPEPAYEDGEIVYQKSVELITLGMREIANASTTPGASDVMFGGQKEKWLRFGNTIKLRALIRQSEKGDPEWIQNQIDLILEEGSGFLQTHQHATVQPGYLNVAGKTNPFWVSYYKNIEGVWVSNYLDISPTQFVVEAYAQRQDPRLVQLYLPAQGHGSQRGVLFGNPDASVEYNRANTSTLLGPGENGGLPAGLLKSPGQPVVLMGGFESMFLQAEAALRGWLPLNSQDLYYEGIASSFQYLGVNDPQLLQQYLENDLVVFDQSLEQLIKQKWLALNSINSIEAWNDFRRLGLPQIPNSLSAPTSLARPQRLMYPESEVQSNGRQVALRNITDITTAKVWWMP